MSIYALGDLHLSLGEGINKPMDIYGQRWENHVGRLKKNWENLLCPNDTMVLAGDISWALKFHDAIPDLEWIHQLPGKKVIIKGNHDLWWTGIHKMNDLYEDITFLHNFSLEVEGIALCGSRGWICPGADGFTEADNKIYNRELLRLQRSLEDARQKECKKIIGVIHFPPTNDKLQASGFTELFSSAGAEQVVYGHLHGADTYEKGINGIFNGVKYNLVSLDYLNCMPLKIYEGESNECR